ncbi:MAG: alpha-ketoglutarate-dependent dioxygenase AlkB [Pseudomonadales bacterium]|nr:alpha-ketoglutarate-dependent dioxygenase AlkB [Pseudomonadales bacterium]MDP6472915.1 alpha-ketoglutarate-dependent dioxygenase AlkB [Pseudomonadales bacterium]MDP6826328.1 alpha-ketoglutarate-dependent dioxygenase AlkB [Pseudomonadales bacterium]MDP6973259.1 alpha-ketoglutarate-dependent dioxygenase AlkB [Pseudomonadales bacterium]
MRTDSTTANADASGSLPDYRLGWLSDADTLLDWCLHRVPWRTECIHIAGREVLVPRLVSWFGEHGLCYRYCGCDHVAHGWPHPLRGIRDRLAAEGRLDSNFVLLNHYRDGNDCMGWHRDDERGMSQHVCALSLGATRRLRLRDTIARQGAPGSSRAVDLQHGSLIEFDARIPHRITRTRRPVGPRVSLTFRVIEPALCHH